MGIAEADLIKILVAILVGGAIGAEREYRDKAAGFRTNILICVGATLFTMFSLRLGGTEDPVRIAASVVSGVGFLGAGAIMRDSGRVMGLTTASTIWLVAALGMGIGGGFYEIVGVATAAILTILWIFPTLEGYIDRARELRHYSVVCAIKPGKFEELEQRLIDAGLSVRSHKHFKRGEDMICEWSAYGSPKKHDHVVESFFADDEIRTFRF